MLGSGALNRGEISVKKSARGPRGPAIKKLKRGVSCGSVRVIVVSEFE